MASFFLPLYLVLISPALVNYLTVCGTFLVVSQSINVKGKIQIMSIKDWGGAQR